MSSCSFSVPTKATPVLLVFPAAATAAAMAPTAEAASFSAYLTVPASSRPFAPSASTIDALSDRPQASSRKTVTAELALASAIIRAMKWPCLAAVIAVRNRLSSAIDSDSASEP